MEINLSKDLNYRTYEPKRKLISDERLANNFKPGILKQVLAFIEFCKSGSKHDSLTDLEEATKIIEEIESLYL